jgi:hypothetical protein
MSIDISWHVNKRVIHIVVQGSITPEDIDNVNATMVNLIDNGEAPVHIIADASAMSQFPTNLKVLWQKHGYLSHPDVGWVILVNSNQLVKFLGNLVTSMAKVRYRTVNTRTEALDLLSHLDPNLPTV